MTVASRRGCRGRCLGLGRGCLLGTGTGVHHSIQCLGDGLLGDLGLWFWGLLSAPWRAWLVLVVQAAHEPAAEARELAGVQDQVLLLGHLDGYGRKALEPCLAAKLLPAYPKAAYHLGGIADAYLPELYAGAELGG